VPLHGAELGEQPVAGVQEPMLKLPSIAHE